MREPPNTTPARREIEVTTEESFKLIIDYYEDVIAYVFIHEGRAVFYPEFTLDEIKPLTLSVVLRAASFDRLRQMLAEEEYAIVVDGRVPR